MIDAWHFLRAAAIRNARQSCIEYLVRNMDDQRAIDEIDVDGSAE